MKSTADNKKEIEAKDISDEEKKIEMETKNAELIKEAAASIGSISSDELDIRFNSDVFSDTVTLVADDAEKLRQKQLIVDVATYVLQERDLIATNTIFVYGLSTDRVMVSTCPLKVRSLLFLEIYISTFDIN